MEEKYELINSDYITIKNPITSAPVKLYRILALRELSIRVTPNEYTPTISSVIIPKYSIGGYIESLDNLSKDDESWVGGSAKVFGGAIISMDSIVTDDAIVYGNVLVEKSYIGGFNRTFSNDGNLSDKFKIHNCIFYGKSLVEGLKNTTILNTIATNSALLKNNKHVLDTVVTGGSFIVDSSVTNSKLFNVSGIKRSNISNCNLYERFTYVDVSASNEDVSSFVELNFINGDK